MPTLTKSDMEKIWRGPICEPSRRCVWIDGEMRARRGGTELLKPPKWLRENFKRNCPNHASELIKNYTRGYWP